MAHDRSRWRRVARVRSRRFLAKLDRLAPAWLLWLPSWGTSVLIHAVALVILATLVFVQGRERADRADFDSQIVSLADVDLTSMTVSDHSGDPFTERRSDETPSLSLDPVDRGISQPSMLGATFGPTLSMPSRISPSSARGLSDTMASVRMHTEDMTAPFSGRSATNRAALVRREGGSTASEKAVQEGLNWLMRHQRDDGGWNLDVHGECKGQAPCPEDVMAESATAATGLALLPFLGAGHIHTQPSRYQEQVRRGIDWLISHQQKDGMLYLGSNMFNAQIYSHAIASMALCEAYGLSKDERIKEPAQRAINFIVQSQNKYDGGWRYTPGMEGDTSVFGWQMFALRSARLSGLNVPKNVIRGCAHYLDEAGSDKLRTTYGYLPGRPASPVMSAEALLCRQYLGWPRDLPAMVKGAGAVWEDLQASNERNIYYWYYATQLLHNMQNKAWKQWNVKVRDGLVAMQVVNNGCDRGSWSPIYPVPDRWGTKGGRLFQTSLSILTLEVYYRFLPLYRTNDLPADGSPKVDSAAEMKPEK